MLHEDNIILNININVEKFWRIVHINIFSKIYCCICYAIDGKGGYFPSVQKDPHQFVEKCSEDIKLWLKSLRQPDKLVFLLTASQIDYASCLLKVILGWVEEIGHFLLNGSIQCFQWWYAIMPLWLYWQRILGGFSWLKIFYYLPLILVKYFIFFAISSCN